MHGIQSKPPSDIMFKQNAISPNQEKIKVSLLSRSKERLLNSENRRKVKYHEGPWLSLLSLPFRYKAKERESGIEVRRMES